MSAKKVAIAGVASVLLVAMVVAVAINVTKSNGQVSGTGTSTKAVQTICSPTNYKETCENTLSKANTTNPKELIKITFEATIQNVGDVLKNSTLLKQAAADSSTKEALDVCNQVLETAVDDLRKSYDKMDEFSAGDMAGYVEDLRTWLSAVITNEETCIDAFENTTGDTGEKMKNLLKTTRELSSNGLAMVSDISSILGQLQIGNIGGGGGASTRRRLLVNKYNDEMRRRLLAAAEMKPNAVVALDGSGQFTKINDAIATVPLKNTVPFVIHVKAGVYEEYVVVPKKKNFIIMVGDGPLKTRVTGNKNYAAGVKTYHTATVAVDAGDFFAKDIAFENSAGPEGHQAVALRASGDNAVFFNVHMDGYQDTLYAHANRQFYRDCQISGTIDFVFGDALSIFQNCIFIIRNPMPNQACMVTAQGRVEERSIGAIIIQHGDITAEPALLAANPRPKTYLGRPWKLFSRTIIMHTNIGGSISPDGWAPWDKDFALDTLYYGEYQNKGPGSSTANRVKWKGIKVITPQIAESWTPSTAFVTDAWIKDKGIPYVPGMMNN